MPGSDTAGLNRAKELLMLDRGYRLLALGGFDWRVLQQTCATFLEQVRA